MITVKNGKELHGLYLLPSLFTSGNLASGFISVIFSIHNHYTPAAWAIIISMVMDIFDGRVARWTKTTSTFGIEYDSLADLVSFGVAPSILMYQMILNTMGKPGVAIAVFFVVAGALRLARFNIKTDNAPATHFTGLPIPAAAGILASFVLSYELFENSGHIMTVKTMPILIKRMPFFFKTIPILMVLISFLMISTVPYMAFKKFKFNRPKSLQLFILVLVGLLLILAYPQNTIFIIFMVYLLSGFAGYIIRYFRMRQYLSEEASKTQEASKDRKENCEEPRKP